MRLAPFLSLAAALCLTACASGLDYERHFPQPASYAIHGVDVSKYQGDIDWQAARGDGVRFAYIKATEGGDLADEKFRQNWDNAAAAGVKRGAYHFVFWCRSPEEQIRWFTQNVPVDEDALPPVLDVELTPTSKTCKRKLYQEQTIAEMREMLVAMERHFGKRPVIYSTVDFYDGILRPNALTEYPIWLRSTKYHPNERFPGRKWHFWQYQSDGYVRGITGKVDRNTFFGDHRQWQAFLDGQK